MGTSQLFERAVRGIGRRAKDLTNRARSAAPVMKWVAPRALTARDVRDHRRRFLEGRVPVSSCTLLEIGAFDQPLYAASEANVRYLDRFSYEELNAAHGHNPRRQAANAVVPDYVCKGSKFSQSIPDRFDVVIANHVIEHVPDLLGWLDEVATVTRSGGWLFMAIPDRRYTFDYLRRETSLTDLIRSREEGLETPSVYQIFDNIYFHRKLSVLDAWTKDPVAHLGPPRFETAEAAWRDAKIHAPKPNVDIHCNVFSYDGFLRLWSEVESLSSVKWRLDASEPPRPMSNEFRVLMARRT